MMPKDLFNSTDNDAPIDKRTYHVVFELTMQTFTVMDYIEDEIVKKYPRAQAIVMYQYEAGEVEIVGYDTLAALVKWESVTSRWNTKYPWSPIVGKTSAK